MAVKITTKTNGPLIVSGDIELVKLDGTAIPTTPGKDTYLCRCGQSSNKPFCDGTHAKVGFKAE